MSTPTIEVILSEIERLLGLAGELPAEAMLAIEKLLIMVQILNSENQSQAAGIGDRFSIAIKRLCQRLRRWSATTLVSSNC